MKTDEAKPTVTIKTTLEKFDGDKKPGDEPVEVVETIETMTLDEFLAQQEQ